MFHLPFLILTMGVMACSPQKKIASIKKVDPIDRTLESRSQKEKNKAEIALKIVEQAKEYVQIEKSFPNTTISPTMEKLSNLNPEEVRQILESEQYQNAEKEMLKSEEYQHPEKVYPKWANDLMIAAGVFSVLVGLFPLLEIIDNVYELKHHKILSEAELEENIITDFHSKGERRAVNWEDFKIQQKLNGYSADGLEEYKQVLKENNIYEHKRRKFDLKVGLLPSTLFSAFFILGGSGIVNKYWQANQDLKLTNYDEHRLIKVLRSISDLVNQYHKIGS